MNYQNLSSKLLLLVSVIAVCPSISFSEDKETSSENIEEPPSLESVIEVESQSETEIVPELYITPNLVPVEQSKIGSSFSVITKEDIERSKKVYLLDVLKVQPGLEVAQSGARGGVTSVFIRGGDSDHTLVLIDGLRANSSATGQFDFANFSTLNIERIEIVKGPQSVLYGSEALAGVINIITKKGTGPLNVYGTVAAGSFFTENFQVGLNKAEEKIQFSLGADYLRSKGFTTAAKENGATERDSFERKAISGQVSGDVLSDGTLSLATRYTEGEAELDGFDFEIGPVDDLDFRQESSLFSSILKFNKPVLDYLDAEVTAGYVEDKLEGFDDTDEFNNFDITAKSAQAKALLKLHSLWSGNLALGYSVEEKETDNKDNFTKDRTVNSVFLEQMQDVGPVLLTAGLRYEDDSEFGDELTWRANSVVSCPISGSKLHASFAKGFKAPSFNELYFPNFGNLELEAETANSFDIGLEKGFLENKFNFDLSFFRSEVDNLISFDSETFLAANIKEARSHGIESGLKYAPNEKLTLRIFYTWTDSEDKETGEILPRRPEHRGGAEVDYLVDEKLELGATWLIVNSRIESDQTEMDDYDKLDLRLSYKVNQHLKPFVRIDNVFDKDYQEINGYQNAGLSVFAGLEFRN